MVLIKNIALSYTVPQSWLKKCGASSAQVYAQVLNPFLLVENWLKLVLIRMI